MNVAFYSSHKTLQFYGCEVVPSFGTTEILTICKQLKFMALNQRLEAR